MLIPSFQVNICARKAVTYYRVMGCPLYDVGYMKISEAQLQVRFTKWMREDFKRCGGGGGGGGVVFKISDFSPEIKPFDCFAIGAPMGSWLWSQGYSSGAFELKMARRGKSGGGHGSIPFSAITKSAHQCEALLRCFSSGVEEKEQSGSAGYYVFGFYGSGASVDGGVNEKVARRSPVRVFVVNAGMVAEKVIDVVRGAYRARGSIGVEWCLEYGVEIEGV